MVTSACGIGALVIEFLALMVFADGATDNIFTYFRFLFIITLMVFTVIVMVACKDE